MQYSSLLRKGVFAVVALVLVAAFVVGFGHSRAGLSATSWFGVLTLSQHLELVAGVIVRRRTAVLIRRSRTHAA